MPSNLPRAKSLVLLLFPCYIFCINFKMAQTKIEKEREREQKREMEFLSDHILRQYLFYVYVSGISSDDPKGVCGEKKTVKKVDFSLKLDSSKILENCHYSAGLIRSVSSLYFSKLSENIIA